MIIDKDKIISELILRLDKLERRIRELEFLEKKNELLRERLAKYKTPKNSRNSSLPLSADRRARPAIWAVPRTGACARGPAGSLAVSRAGRAGPWKWSPNRESCSGKPSSGNPSRTVMPIWALGPSLYISEFADKNLDILSNVYL